MSYHKSKNLNPAIGKAKFEQNLKEAMEKQYRNGMNYASSVHNLITLIVLADKTDMDDNEIIRIKNEIDNVAESIIGKYVTIPDIIIALKEEHNFNIDEDNLIKWYPELEGVLKDDNEG